MSECIFCKIVSGKQDASVIYEDDRVLSFLDHRLIRIGHTLVISKTHYETILDIPDNELTYLIQITKKLARQIKTTLNAKGLQVSNNNYPAAKQMVPHIHFHIIPITEDVPLKVKFERIKISNNELEKIANKILKIEIYLNKASIFRICFPRF
ncbi:MAG: HIT domain-containing protein [Candidatus Helarchaeota archaeon]|nr:HIT domain-containing protein [Candidatus Helarchaeota archaeon]